MVTIRIGRNVGSEPMSFTDWHRFILDVQDLFEGEVDAEQSFGEWEGVAEENATITGILATNFITAELAHLAQHFEQDAIAIHVPAWDSANWVLVDQAGTLSAGWPV